MARPGKKTVGICIAIILCALMLREITKKDREGGSQLPEAPTKTLSADEAAQIKQQFAEIVQMPNLGDLKKKRTSRPTRPSKKMRYVD